MVVMSAYFSCLYRLGGLEPDLARSLLRERERAPNLLDMLSKVLLRLSTCCISSRLSCWVPSSSLLPPAARGGSSCSSGSTAPQSDKDTQKSV